ncbi:mechanosensitive ion channel family protein [Emcibacter nanhaiensis]|uniref:Mechanosensitive ion channel n=1 Tax=Emcibacter nanhaiensis TaxID=1505037 RepID=A0A501PAV3_9PROT|nr:mechanosensitive ion channel domain-containing protein [Emcibacter nanhaiensis]TPD57483.1 mechanosensitive ion channel [Emcibacter nanhaiensis]
MSSLFAKILKPSGWISSWLIGSLFLALAAAGYFGYLQPLKEFLERPEFLFTIGDYEVSVYMILKAIVILVLIFWVTAALSGFGEKRINALTSFGASSKALLIKVFQSILYFVALLLALDIMGIDLTALTVLGGAVGIGIGFGLQNITSNFISGIILLSEKSIEKDDLVELDGGVSGFVRQTHSRYTLVETFDGKEVMIPNEDFITNRVTNWTYSNTRGRIEVRTGVSYKSDIRRAHELILEAAREHPDCLEDPAPVCFLEEFADSSVNFVMYFWVGDVTIGRLKPKSDVMYAIWDKFHANNIEIPFPQRDVHLIGAENAAE